MPEPPLGAEPYSALAPPADWIRERGREVLEVVARYYESLRDLPVYPHTTAREVWALLGTSLPREGRDLSDLLAVFRDVVLPHSRHNGHPRFFGYVSSPGTAVAALADLLASTLNANVTSWRSAPAAAQMEHVVIDWIKEILGYDPGGVGLFVSGGSMANLAALAAARHHAVASLSEEGDGR